MHDDIIECQVEVIDVSADSAVRHCVNDVIQFHIGIPVYDFETSLVMNISRRKRKM